MYNLMEVLPYISYALLGITLVCLEIRTFAETRTSGSTDTDHGFTPPPGDGYTYYCSSDTVVYIHRKARRCYRAYIVRSPHHVMLKHDRYGRYHTVRCGDSATAEHVIDRIYARKGD